MAISAKIDNYLNDHQINYELLNHRRSEGAFDTSVAAHVPMTNLVKAVLLVDHDDKHLLALLPGSHLLNINRLNSQLCRTFRFVDEERLSDFFSDCEFGAIPAIGQAYNLPVLCEDLLYEQAEVYLEGGDHRALIQLSKQDFRELMKNQKHMSFSEGRTMHLKEGRTNH